MAKKGENIYKRKDNRWEARYIKGYTSEGLPKYGYCYGKTYKESKRKVLQAKTDFLSGKQQTQSLRKKYFEDYCEEWLFLNKNRVKESTYAKYCGIFEVHIRPHLGKLHIRKLNSVIVEQFSNQLLYEESLSPKTVKDVLTVLNSVIKYISKQSQEIITPIEIIYPRIPKKEMRVLTREEQSVFVEYLLDDMDEYKFGILLALLTGMRIGEVCALRWENIHFSDGVIQVRNTMQRIRVFKEDSPNKTKVIIGDAKSESSSRLIPMINTALKLCEMRKCEDLSAFVLTGDKHHYIEPRAMQYRLARYTKECGLDGVHFHTLRHTFATRCVEVDFEIKSLSEILGHSSPRITLERYVHSSIELKKENMNKLASIGY